jgi:hypothetical protein
LRQEGLLDEVNHGIFYASVYEHVPGIAARSVVKATVLGDPVDGTEAYLIASLE